MAEILQTHTLLFLTSCISPLFLVTDDAPALLPFPRVPASLSPFSGFALGEGACAPVLSAWLFHLDWSSGRSQTSSSVFCLPSMVSADKEGASRTPLDLLQAHF